MVKMDSNLSHFNFDVTRYFLQSIVPKISQHSQEFDIYEDFVIPAVGVLKQNACGISSVIFVARLFRLHSLVSSLTIDLRAIQKLKMLTICLHMFLKKAVFFYTRVCEKGFCCYLIFRDEKNSHFNKIIQNVVLSFKAF